MINIVVDTNILFSALRSKDSVLRSTLLNSKDKRFFAPNFLFSEIFKHKEKLIQKTQATEEQVYEFF